MKENIVSISEEVLKEYLTALYNSQFGSPLLMNAFKCNHLEEYKFINTMYRKRSAMKESIDIMQRMNEPVYWFTLTFNNEKNANTIESKRKEAQRFLNRLASVYLMVEEFGEDNGRYHIHGFLVFKYGFGFIDFQEWHSRQNILLCENAIANKKIKYLTKYAVKSVPRIRRSKSLSVLYCFYKKHKRLSKSFPSMFKEDFNREVAKVVNPF